MRRPVSAVVLLAAALGVAGCGGSDAGGGDGPTVKGSGYEYRAPEGWQDRKGEVAETPQSVVRTGGVVRDSIFAEPARPGSSFRTNLATTYDPLPAQGTSGAQELEPLTEMTRRGIASLVDTVSPATRTTLGGDPARVIVARRRVEGEAVEQRQILAIHDGWLYTVTSSAATDGQARASADALEAARSSWAWR